MIPTFIICEICEYYCNVSVVNNSNCEICEYYCQKFVHSDVRQSEMHQSLHEIHANIVLASPSFLEAYEPLYP